MAAGLIVFNLAVHPVMAQVRLSFASPHTAQLLNSTSIENQTPCQNPNELVASAQRLAAQWRRPSLEQAIADYVKAADCFQRDSRTAASADALKAAGDIYFILSDYKKAVDCFSQILALKKAGSDRSGEAGALADIAHSLIFLGEKEQARQRAEESLLLSQTIGDQHRLAQSHFVRGMVLLLSGDTRNALESENSALALLNDTKDEELLARVLLALGYVHNDLDDLEESLSFYNSALVKWRALQNRWGECRTLTSIGLVQTLLGDRQAALDALGGTLPVLEEMGDRLSQAAALNNLAYVYQTLNELGPALEYFTKALVVYQQMKFVLGEAITLQYCADIYALMGDPEKAITTYDLAIQRSREVANALLIADGLNSLGSIYFKRGDHQKAIDLFNQSLSEYQKANHWRGQASALSNIGYYYETLPNQNKAIDCYNEALTFARSAQDRESVASILYNLARVEMNMGLANQARAHIEESLKLNEAARAKVANQDLRISYFASVHQHYDLYIDLLMQLHQQHPNDGFDLLALQASEKARARSLLELLSQTGVNIDQNVEPYLRRRERELRSALNAAYFSTSERSAKQSTEQLQQLEIQYEEIKNKIRAGNFKYASLIPPATFDFDTVKRRLLDSNTAILEYSLGERRSFLWVITVDGVKTYVLPSRTRLESELQTLIERLARLSPDAPIRRDKRVTLRELENDYWQQAEKASSLVFADALTQTSASRLVIIGSGLLESVPFAALTKPAVAGQLPRQPQALIEEYEVVKLPSISIMTVLDRQVAERVPATLSVAVFADPVFEANDSRLLLAKGANQSKNTSDSQHTMSTRSAVLSRALVGSSLEKGIGRLIFSRREAEAISDVVPGAFVALDFRANRAGALSNELAKYRMIHFATHGIINDKHPELSGILLSMIDEKGKPQDGFLQLSDIYNLNLPADLVVLSACESGLGKPVRGEGLIGLTRGFMHAGAARVLGSLWKVDDAATAALMANFYKEMFANKKSPADALRSAQIHISQEKRWQSPYYWAGFVLQGDWR